MKILLILPPDIHMIKTNVPSFVDQGIGVYPSLGLLYIATSILRRTDWQVELLDCKAENITYDTLEEEIQKRNPDVVGIQVLTFTSIDAILTAKTVKSINPRIYVIFGGPHVNIYPQESLSMPCVDFIILGEGEYSVCEFLEALRAKTDFGTIKGLGYKKHGELCINPQQKFISNLDALPYPDRTLLKWERYFSIASEHSPITTMISSRGCPFHCLYCYRPHLGKEFRARSAENVVQEMSICQKMGIKDIFFYDDTFTVDRRRVLDICDLIVKQKVSIDWDVRAHINTVDEVILSKMAQAGCRRIHFGVESGTPEIQKVLKKDLDLNKVKRVFSEAKKAGLKTLAYFMLGCPTETKKQIEQTVNFMLELNTDFVHISVATPFPSTEMYTLGFTQGLYQKDFWREFAQNPSEDFSPEFWIENLTKDELFVAVKNAYKRFYFRPAYVIQSLLQINNSRNLRQKFSAGIKMFFS